MSANRECCCGESLIESKYQGELRTTVVYFMCATHRRDPMSLVNARRELRRRLERKALPAPSVAP